jgi:two-component system OmpR family response regulator
MYSSMGLKVLVIDDEKDICSLLDSFLTKNGYAVKTASTLHDGMELMKELRPDIIFLDNNLPDGLGWDQVDFIQQALPACKINLISAYKFVPESIRNKPAVGLIEKPISFTTLKNYL